MNSKIYRQADSRWGSLPYPTKAYSFAGNGCGCCAVTHCAIELDKYKNYTPADVRKYMVQFATKGHGTLWDGITKGLEHYGYKVSHPNVDKSMTPAWDILNGNSLKRGVVLFGSTKGPDGTEWTGSGHYISFVDYKIQDGKHYFYLKDSGGRKHDKWWCYEKSMKGDVRQVWMCTSLSEKPAPAPTPVPTPTRKYTGSLPSPTLKKGSKGSQVKLWQKFLNWYGYNCGTVDGIFGTKTVGATKSFQYKEGITSDGIVGKKTLAKAKVYL